MWKKYFIIFTSVLIYVIAESLCACAVNTAFIDSSDIMFIRDSLDKIIIPSPVYHKYEEEVNLQVYNQEEWESICTQIKNYLKKGFRNIRITVKADTLISGMEHGIENLQHPDANIQIVANKTVMIPSGPIFTNLDGNKKDAGTHYAIPYADFNLNDVVLGFDLQQLSLMEEVFCIDSKIEEVNDDGKIDILNPDGSLYKSITKTWRFKTDLPNLSEFQCKDFFILLTRHWTSCRHQVVRVKDGYLYFRLKSEDAPTLVQMCMDPNSDIATYSVAPRCRLINSPVSKGIHITGDSIFIPKQEKIVKIGKGGRLLSVVDCKFNSFEISGFRVAGSGGTTCIYMSSSSFEDMLWIKNNLFTNLSSSAMTLMKTENVCVYNNKISNTRVCAMNCYGNNISIHGNYLKDIGYMLQTIAVAFSGKNNHVFENIIEDFNYSAIATGNKTPSRSVEPETYIIERNVIRHTRTFVQNYLKRTVADGGGIYIAPQNTQGIIRNNVIQNITGIHSNRGIFLDDGVKNLAIYGNYISGTANCYDIDLRYCATYAQDIPDHNTNNIMIQNIISGSYRFEEKDSTARCVVGGNLLLESGIRQLGHKISVSRRAVDRDYSGAFTKSVIENTRIDPFVEQYLNK